MYCFEFFKGLYLVVFWQKVIPLKNEIFHVKKKRAWGKNRAFFTHVAGSYVIFWNKRNFYVRKRFDSHQTGLEHQHRRYFIVLGLQYGGRDM